MPPTLDAAVLGRGGRSDPWWSGSACAPESASEQAQVSWMKEPYVEGLASHRGPGSYADSREAVGGALIGVSTGWDDEPRNQSSRRRRRRRGRRKAIFSSSLGQTGWGTRGQSTHEWAETLCLKLGDLQPPHGQR